MLTLGIGTATDVCSVALLDGTTPLVHCQLAVPRSHGRRLALLIQETLAHASRAVSDLDLVAVSAGPGSYTGLRIGMSTAKGICLATGAPLAAVPTMLALGYGASGTGVVLLPSRRGEAYAAVVAQGEFVLTPAALSVDHVDAWLPDHLDWIGGPGSDRISNIRPTVPRLALSASAASVALVGQRRFASGGPDPVDSTEPLYLKPVAVSQPRGIFETRPL